MDSPDFFINNPLFMTLIIHYGINLLAVTALVRLIYFTHYKRTDLFLTFFAFNSIIFFVTYLLNKVEMSTGAAFGLFAVFSMLRYRTEGISAKDMTYLFLSIAIGLLTAVSQGTVAQVVFICSIILLLTFILEGNWLMKKEFTKSIYYDNISLLHENRKSELQQDLINRTGLNIKRFTVDEIDFLKDAGKITIIYTEK